MTIHEYEAGEVTGGWKTGKINQHLSQLYKTVNLAADIRRNGWKTCSKYMKVFETCRM